MASNGDSRGGLLTAGGVLCIVAGISQIISILLFAAVAYFPKIIMYWPHLLYRVLFLTFFPDFLRQFLLSELILPEILLFLICTGVLGIVAIIGGMSAIRRKRFGLSLAGAICALPSVILGVLAIIFVSVSRREFRSVRC